MSRRWQSEFEEAFWTAVLTLPGWPDSWRAIVKACEELASTAAKDEPVPGTLVCVVKINLMLPDQMLLRLVLYFTRSETAVRFLYVEDFDNPRDPTDPTHPLRPAKGDAGH
jgi:hypothetical protein